jgi:hypothetical protein
MLETEDKENAAVARSNRTVKRKLVETSAAKPRGHAKAAMETVMEEEGTDDARQLKPTKRQAALFTIEVSCPSVANVMASL